MSPIPNRLSYAAIAAAKSSVQGQRQEQAEASCPQGRADSSSDIGTAHSQAQHLSPIASNGLSVPRLTLERPRPSSTQPMFHREKCTVVEVRDDSYRLPVPSTPVDMPARMKQLVSNYTTHLRPPEESSTCDTVEEYRRVFHAITNCALAPSLMKDVQVLPPKGFNPRDLSSAELAILRMRFHCAVFDGIEDRFCDCCDKRPRNQAELRFEAIEVAILVYQDFEENATGRRPAYPDALLHCRKFLMSHGIALSDIEAELIRADRLPMFRTSHLIRHASLEETNETSPDNDCDSGFGSEHSDQCADVVRPVSTTISAVAPEVSAEAKTQILVNDIPIDENIENQSAKVEPSEEHETKLKIHAREASPPLIMIQPIHKRRASYVPIVQDAQPLYDESFYSRLYVESPKPEECIDNGDSDQGQQKMDPKPVPVDHAKRKSKKGKKHHKKQKSKDVQGASTAVTVLPDAEPAKEHVAACFHRLWTIRGEQKWYDTVESIPESDFHNFKEVREKVDVFYHAGRTLAETHDHLQALLAQAPPGWKRDFEARCLDVYKQQIQMEQQERGQRRFTMPELDEKRLNGVNRDRVRLAIGDVTPKQFVDEFLYGPITNIPGAEQIKALKVAIYALLDHTTMQFEDRLHIVPDDRVELLNKLKRKMNGLGGRLDLKEYRKAGQGFREVFERLAADARRLAIENQIAKEGCVRHLRELCGDNAVHCIDTRDTLYTDTGESYSVVDLQAVRDLHDADQDYRILSDTFLSQASSAYREENQGSGQQNTASGAISARA